MNNPVYVCRNCDETGHYPRAACPNCALRLRVPVEGSAIHAGPREASTGPFSNSTRAMQWWLDQFPAQPPLPDGPSRPRYNYY
jgi:hypothetical protein